MSLSEPLILNKLSRRFVCGWRNIEGKESYAGRSHQHDPTNPAVYTTNGAGSKNVQMVFVGPDGRVLHCLPGYWNPRDLAHELEFALVMQRIASSDRPVNVQHDEVMLANLNHALWHSGLTSKNSKLQGFDAMAEKRKENSVFQRVHGGGRCGLKTVDQVIHEKMAERPLMDYHDFDIAAFVSYGTKYYDKHGDGCQHGKKKETPPKKK